MQLYKAYSSGGVEVGVVIGAKWKRAFGDVVDGPLDRGCEGFDCFDCFDWGW